MGQYLTNKVRLEQTNKKRVFRTLDNELYKDDDGTIYIVPRYFCTDNYTIPLWVSVIGGSPVDYRVEPSHLHDLACVSFSVVYVKLTEKQLEDKGYYRFSKSRYLWVCEDIPKEYLGIKNVTRKQANDLLYRAMKASNIPWFKRCIVRIGVFFNIGWFITKIAGTALVLDLDKFYNREFWGNLLK